jgi:hypothetical protein
LKQLNKPPPAAVEIPIETKFALDLPEVSPDLEPAYDSNNGVMAAALYDVELRYRQSHWQWKSLDEQIGSRQVERGQHASSPSPERPSVLLDVSTFPIAVHRIAGAHPIQTNTAHPAC